MIEITGLAAAYGMTDTVIQLAGIDMDTGEEVIVIADHRPAMHILERIREGEGPILTDPPEYTVIRGAPVNRIDIGPEGL